MNLWEELIQKIFATPSYQTPVVRGPPNRTTDDTVWLQKIDVEVKKERGRGKSSLTRGLSRYGPWGYLMLGMLLCGAALLICGLWGEF